MKLFLVIILFATILGGFAGGEVLDISFSILGAVIGGIGTVTILLGLGAYFSFQEQKLTDLSPEVVRMFDRMITGQQNPTPSEVMTAKQAHIKASQMSELSSVTDVLKLSATKGDAHSQKLLGELYLKVKNYDDALKWLLLAAEQNDFEALNTLATMYEDGLGVSQNYKKALDFYMQAASFGCKFSAFSAGRMYFEGVGSVKNIAESAKWFSKSAEYNNSYAQEILSTLYFSGNGVAQDYTKAYFWAFIAVANGNERGKVILHNLENKIAPSETFEALNDVKEWMKKRGKSVVFNTDTKTIQLRPLVDLFK